MNCRRFQHRLYEYLDGTLPPSVQAAADRHLSGCAACRHTLDRERRTALVLSDRFRQATGPMQLPPEVGRRVLTALAEEGATPWQQPASLFSWLRFAWPQALAASALLLLAGLFYFARLPASKTISMAPRRNSSEVLVQLSYVVPIYTFRHEDGFVVDALTYQTNVLNERFPASLARLE